MRAFIEATKESLRFMKWLAANRPHLLFMFVVYIYLRIAERDWMKRTFDDAYEQYLIEGNRPE